jgi:hypothetical protein
MVFCAQKRRRFYQGAIAFSTLAILEAPKYWLSWERLRLQRLFVGTTIRVRGRTFYRRPSSLSSAESMSMPFTISLSSISTPALQVFRSSYRGTRISLRSKSGMESSLSTQAAQARGDSNYQYPSPNSSSKTAPSRHVSSSWKLAGQGDLERSCGVVFVGVGGSR